MKLTTKQIDVLYRLNDDKTWLVPTSNAHGNTLNSLFNKGLIDARRYANGTFCEMTDKGINELKLNYRY